MSVPAKRLGRFLLLFLLQSFFISHLHAATSSEAKQAFSQLLLGKDVKSLIEMPAYKEGIDIYFTASSGKHTDERGLDFDEMTKWLKSKGVGIERDEWVTITDVKIDSDKIEIHLGGGGEGRRGSNHANKMGAGFKRAGGSRINFHYQRSLTDEDLKPEAFFPFMSRLLDTSKVQEKVVENGLPDEFKDAVASKTIKEGMTYQMVLLSFGDPDQKKIDENATDSDLHETWYYLKDGHRWVVKFDNGKVEKTQVF